MAFRKKTVKEESSENFAEDIVGEIQKEIFLNIPNSLTLLRLILTFVFIYLLFMNYSKLILIIVFVIAALTDYFDGFFARRLNQKTKIGARLDQLIDRVFTVGIVLSIIIYLIINNMHNSSSNTILLLFLACSREIISIPGVIIALARKKDWYKVKFIGKLTTFVQCFALGAIIIQVDWAIYLVIPTSILGIIAAFDYLRYSLS